jgi:hypothetical protein
VNSAQVRLICRQREGELDSLRQARFDFGHR